MANGLEYNHQLVVLLLPPDIEARLWFAVRQPGRDSPDDTLVGSEEVLEALRALDRMEEEV